jgi:hypothetical protein
MNLFTGLGSFAKGAALFAGLGLAAMMLAFVPSPLRVFDLFDSAPVVEIKTPPPLKMAAISPATAFEAIVARPLFNIDRKPDPVPPPPEPPKPAIVLGDLTQYRVEGVVVSSETQLALVRKTGAQLLTLRQGDTLEGWKIDKIESRGISISGGDRTEVLTTPKAKNAAPSP